MRIGQIVFVVALGFAAWQFGISYKSNREQNRFVANALKNGGDSLRTAGVPKNCQNKKYCITAFIAPWCGVCNSSIPTFFALNKTLPALRSDVGFGLVIGAAELGEMKAKQKELESIESYIDDTGDILKSRGIQAFPTWIVTDSSGNEISRKAAGLSATEEAQIKVVLHQIFKLD